MAPVFSTAEELRAAMRAHEALSPADIGAIERLTALYAYCFDTCNSSVAAELYTEDAVNRMITRRDGSAGRGIDVIRKGFAKQEQTRRQGTARLRSRHVVSNVCVRPDAEVPGLVHGSCYLTLFRNPDSDHPANDGPPDALFAPAAVGEYQFKCRKCADGIWRFCEWELGMHFLRAKFTSSVPESKL